MIHIAPIWQDQIISLESYKHTMFMSTHTILKKDVLLIYLKFPDLAANC